MDRRSKKATQFVISNTCQNLPFAHAHTHVNSPYFVTCETLDCECRHYMHRLKIHNLLTHLYVVLDHEPYYRAHVVAVATVQLS